MSGNLGAKIKALRKSLNLTLEDFGKLIFNTSKSNVHKWENNITKPSNKNLIRIAEIANQSLEDFLINETIDVSIFEVNLLLTENKKLEDELFNKEAFLSELHQELDSFLNLKNSDEYAYNSEITSITNEILKLENETETISNEIKKNVKKIAEIQHTLLKSKSAQNLLQESLTSLEALFNSSYPLSINEKEMTAEDKKRALEILKLVFK